MNKKSGLLLIMFQILFGTNIMAQELQTPTLEDLLPGGETFCYPENKYGLQWWGEECIKPEIDTLYAINPQTGIERVVVSREQVNEVLEKAQAGKLQHFHYASFPEADKEQMLIEMNDKYIIYDLKENAIRSILPLKKNAANKDYCTANGKVAYTVANNLYVNETAITSDPEGVVCGQSVHRNEFGIHKGTFWSPKGTLLAFYRMDESMVTQYPLVDATARISKLNELRYPMAGMTSHQVAVGIYNHSNGKTIYLNTGDPTDRYFTNISWSPDEKSLYLIELNRDQNRAKLCQYNAENGEQMTTLFEEIHPKYVEPLQPIVFLPWDATTFIYQSQRDGFNHLYLYNTQGKLLKQLTKGDWLVQEIIGFKNNSKELIIASTEYSPLQSNFFRINLKNEKRTLIGSAEGIHNGILSSSGKYIIDSYSNPKIPRNIDIIHTSTGKITNLLTASNPFEGFKMPIIETGTIKAADGVTDLHYRLVRPTDMNLTQKHPAIVYVYGGPHAQMVTGGWMNGTRGWEIYMANKGYIMFCLDNRGSENRGRDFEDVTFRQLGIEEGKDQIKGVEFLQSLPYVDANRIGAHGWSFGGHMTTVLMLRHPEIFKVGVAGGPVIDWSYYEIMYGERYMDSPQSNPEGYKLCDLKNMAGNLQGHLLIVHDDQDDTCVLQHTLSFMKACIDARTYPDLFIYPGHKHNVIGRDRIHLHEKITRYFEAHL